MTIPSTYPSFIVRRASSSNSSDAEGIAAVGAKSFKKTFESDSTPQEMEEYLSNTYTPGIITKSLLNEHQSFFVAQLPNKGAVVGFSSLDTTIPDYECLRCFDSLIELKRLYVDDTHHGGGVGQALLDAALRHAKESGRCHTWLGVYPENHRAIRFYEKNGFKKVGQHRFVWGDKVDIDDVMVRVL